MNVKRILVMSFLMLFVSTAFWGGNAEADFSFTLPPDAEFTYWPKSGYAPLIVTFEDQSKRADSIEWTLWDRVVDESQFNSGGDTIIYQYLYPGTFPVYLTATSAAGTDVEVAYVTVLPNPAAPTLDVFVGAPRNGPAGTTVQFINLTPGEFEKVLWDFGDNTSSTEEDPSHVYNSPGLYTVSLVLLGDLGIVTETKINYINISPASTSVINPDFSASRTTGTDPHQVQFWPSGGEGKSVLWDFGDGTNSELLTPKHVYKEPGTYTVTLSVDGEEVSKEDYVNILANVDGQTLPAALLLDNDEAQLAILKDFRDNVVSRTLPGLGMIELYYKHSLELVSILQADEDLSAEASAVLTGLLPGFQSVVDGETMSLSPAELDRIKAVIGGIAAQAGPELAQALVQLAIELSDGQSFESMGIGGVAE